MIVVSACLAGVRCRYNGTAYTVGAIVDMVASGMALPVCPELLAQMQVPRPPAEIIGTEVRDSEGQDVTEAYQRGAEIAAQIAHLAGCRQAIIKSKSPTCGCGQIYDGTFSHRIVPGDGLFTRQLKEKGIEVRTEEEFDMV